MMLGFKSRFEPMILDGSKRHTIRAKRDNPPKVGEICHCYVNPRSRAMRLLGRWPCVKVEDLLMLMRTGPSKMIVSIEVKVEGVTLDTAERNALAYADGFREYGPRRAFEAFVHYWGALDSKRSEFSGDIIHWDYDHPATGKPRGRMGR